MNNMPKDALVICPVYNEQETIKKFYQELRDCYAGPFLFVDDCSIDRSREFLARIRRGDTYVIRHRQRKGYGQALQMGFRFALTEGYRKIVTLDADRQHPPGYLSSFLVSLDESEVVLGSRYLQAVDLAVVPPERYLINRLIVRVLKALFAVEFSDPFCGYRAYRRSFLERACLRESSYGFALEVLLEIIRNEASFREIPIETIYFNRSRRFLDGLDDPQERLHYYLDVILSKYEELSEKKKISGGQSSSR